MIGLLIVYQVAVGVFVRVVHSRTRMHMLHRVRKGSGINAPPKLTILLPAAAGSNPK